jgi:hypothetical protein
MLFGVALDPEAEIVRARCCGRVAFFARGILLPFEEPAAASAEEELLLKLGAAEEAVLATEPAVELRLVAALAFPPAERGLPSQTFTSSPPLHPLPTHSFAILSFHIHPIIPFWSSAPYFPLNPSLRLAVNVPVPSDAVF